MNLFSLAAFKIFSLLLVFSDLIMICLGIVFFILLVLGVCLGSPFYFFLWTPSYFFPLNQSGFGNINSGIMTNLSMWERKDVSAVLVEHLGSSYSRERARGPH